MVFLYFYFVTVPSPPIITSDKSLLKLIESTNSLPTANLSCQTQQQKHKHHEELLKQLKLQRQLELKNQQQIALNNNWNYRKSFSPLSSCFVDPNVTPIAFSPPFISPPQQDKRSPITSLNYQPPFTPLSQSSTPLTSLSSSSCITADYQQPLYTSVNSYKVLSEQPRTVLNASQKPSSTFLSPTQPSSSTLSSASTPAVTPNYFTETPTTDTSSTNACTKQNKNNLNLDIENSDSVSCFCATSSPINALFSIICKENDLVFIENMSSTGRRVNGKTDATRPRSSRTTVSTTKAKDDKESQQR